jgi:hypothetical protein
MRAMRMTAPVLGIAGAAGEAISPMPCSNVSSTCCARRESIEPISGITTTACVIGISGVESSSNSPACI